jgi:hypothetical protein
MHVQEVPNIVFKFRRPSGTPSRQPSAAMTQALRQFARSDEMREFVSNARKQRRKVVVEVFHLADGHPMLIHTTILRKKTA